MGHGQCTKEVLIEMDFGLSKIIGDVQTKEL